MSRSYTSSGTFAVVGRPSKTAVDVLAEVIKKSPADADQLYDAVQEAVGEKAWALLLPSNPRGRRVGRRHWLCQMLSEAAQMLDQVADIGGAVEDAVCEGCADAGWGTLRSKAAGMAAGRLAQVTLGPALAPVAVVSMKVRIAAVMFCPDSAKHPCLENDCARQLLAALGIPAGSVSGEVSNAA